MNEPRRRLTNHALHGREEWFKRVFRDIEFVLQCDA